jgi:hypothetical protein
VIKCANLPVMVLATLLGADWRVLLSGKRDQQRGE